MDPYRVKRHDLVPAIEATLVNRGKKPMNLGAAVAVKFIMSSEDAGVTIAAPAQILQGVDPITLAITNEGRVRYAWVPGDTDAIGVYQVEWEIDWGNGALQTVPNKGYGELVIAADLAATPVTPPSPPLSVDRYIIGIDAADVAAKAAAEFPAGTTYAFSIVDSAGTLIDFGSGIV